MERPTARETIYGPYVSANTVAESRVLGGSEPYRDQMVRVVGNTGGTGQSRQRGRTLPEGEEKSKQKVPESVFDKSFKKPFTTQGYLIRVWRKS